MSTQAEIAFKILTRMYIEFDQRSGWSTESQILKVMSVKDGVSEGRALDAIGMLKRLRMLEFKVRDAGNEIKISSYGVEWMDKTCPLLSREPEYEFALPTFGSVKLVAPDEFYKTRRVKSTSADEPINWTKWGAVSALAAIPIPFIIWWLS